jgi:site-specific DNA recombinase
MNVGIYARISEDAEGTRLGVTRQEEDCRGIAKVRRWNVKGLYVDNDISAFDTKVIRPEFERLLADLAAGTIGGVITYDLDRFARQPADLERAIRVFDEHEGLAFATVQSDVDLSNADGRTMARVMVAFANKSSMDASRRIKRKNLELAQRGIPRSVHRPFGYEADMVTICEPEAALLRQAATDVLNGMSMHAIARRWNEQGVTTSTGGQWRQSTLRQALVSPRIAGFRVHQRKIAVDANGERILATRPPILDVPTWEALCAYLKDPARTGRHAHPGGRKHLLSGLVRCGKCGVKMSVNRDPHRRELHVYVCKPATANGGCGGVAVAGHCVDELVAELVVRHLSDRQVAHEIEPWKGEADLDAVTRRTATLMAAFSSGELSSDVVFPTVAKLEDEANQLRNDRAIWLRDQMALANRPTDVSESWPSLATDERRAVIGRVLRSIVVKPAEKKGGRFDPSRVEVVWQ